MLNVVRDYVPEYDWKPWLFRRIPSNYWQNPANRRRYLVWLGKELGFRLPHDWYRLSPQDVVRTGGGLLLKGVCRNRLESLLRERYPNYRWNCERLACAAGRGPEGNGRARCRLLEIYQTKEAACGRQPSACR